MDNRRSYLNARSTLQALLEKGVIPIVNENDTIATEEIRVGDNDNLSAQVANLIEADLLLMLTDQQGIFTADPRRQPDAEMILEINSPDIPDQIWQAAGGTVGALGTGGMVTKLQAADLARRSGTTVVVARGSDPDIVLKVLEEQSVGTWFRPATYTRDSRKRYILLTGRSDTGSVRIDDGAVKALLSGGSLLPVGILETTGQFDRGDVIQVKDRLGKEIARGIANYSSDQLLRIIGQHSMNIDQILGFHYGDEVIHRNNMVVL
jgi:glutamate 5-kinase